MIDNYLAIGAVNILAMTALGYMIRHNDLLDSKMRRHFLYAVLSIGIVIFAEMGTVYDAYPAEIAIVALTGFNIIGFSLSPFVPIIIAAAFGNHFKKQRILFLLPSLINLVFVFLSPVFGYIFSILPDGSYFRGPWFPVFIVSYIFSMLYLLMQSLRVIHIYQNRNQMALFWLFLLFLLGTVIQILFPLIHTTWISVSLAMIMYYAYYCDLLEKHDVMTNLLNRRSYEYYLPVLKIKGSATIITLDVDDFKATNDRHGHPYGDESLRVIAENIKASFGKIGLCYRIGGDEFSVLSEQTSNSVMRNAEELFLAKMDASRRQDPNLPYVSFGRALFDQTQNGIEQVTVEADRRMFQNKQKQKLARLRSQPADSSQ